MYAELILGLLIVIPALNLLASLVRVPYPIVFVLGGVVLALIPGVPSVRLAPDLVLAVALPPLLYGTAYYADPAALRSDLRVVALLAVGLVIATAAGLAYAAHALVSGLPGRRRSRWGRSWRRPTRPPRSRSCNGSARRGC